MRSTSRNGGFFLRKELHYSFLFSGNFFKKLLAFYVTPCYNVGKINPVLKINYTKPVLVKFLFSRYFR